MKSRVLLISLLFAVITSIAKAQIKVIPSGYVSIGLNAPTEQLEVTQGNAFLSSKYPKLYFANRERYIGIPGLGTDGQLQTDLTLLSKNHNWLRIGARGGIALFGDGVCENNSDQDYTMFIGDQGVGIYGSAQIPYSMVVHGDGLVDGQWYNSDERFKQDIKEIDSALDKILRLRGTSFNFRTSEFPEHRFTTNRSLGFIAQELKDVLPEVVQVGSDGYYAVNYPAVIPVLVEAMKEQQAEIEALRAQKKDFPEASQELLFQNAPNPFTHETIIRYHLQNVFSAEIFIHNLVGAQLKRIGIKGKGPGSITIIAGDLTPGLYNYSLVVEGRIVDTKQMLLTD